MITKGRCHCFCGEVLFCRKANITILGFTLWQYSDGAAYWRGNLDWNCQYWYSNLDVCPRKENFPILQFLSPLYSESASAGFSYFWQITRFPTNFLFLISNKGLGWESDRKVSKCIKTELQHLKMCKMWNTCATCKCLITRSFYLRLMNVFSLRALCLFNYTQ